MVLADIAVFVRDVLDRIAHFISDPVGVIESFLGSVFGRFFGVIPDILDEIRNVGNAVARTIFDRFEDLYHVMRGALSVSFSRLVSFLRGVVVRVSGFLFDVVRFIVGKIVQLITVNVSMYVCFKTYERAMELRSITGLLKALVLCTASPFVGGLIGSVASAVIPRPSAPISFVPEVEVPGVEVVVPSEDVIGTPPSFEVVRPVIPLPDKGVVFSVLMDVGVDYFALPGVGLLVGVRSGVSTGYEVGVPGYGLSDSGVVVLSDSWSYGVGRALGLSDSSGVGLSDGWVYSFYKLLSLSDSTGLGLSDVWSYVLARTLSLGDSVSAGLSDSWVYSVGGALYGLSDLAGLSLSDSWSYITAFGLSLGDSVGLSLADSWSYSLARVLSLGDGAGLGLSDAWAYSLARLLSLSDSAGMSLSDSWSYSLARVFSLSDSVGVSLSDSWSYATALALALSDSSGLGLSDSWSYSVGRSLGLSDSAGVSSSDSWGYTVT
jgi:hypothetical protein